MHIHRFLFVCLIFLLGNHLIAQPHRGLKGTYNTDEYPTISFVWNSPNPTLLQKSMFTLTDENEQNVEFDFSQCPKEMVNCKKSVLFLWEDMPSHQNQTETTRKLLKGFFNSVGVDNNTEYNVAVFNRKSDNQKNVLTTLSSSFTSNTSTLATLTEKYAKNRRFYNSHPNQSDLYLAIKEGIDLLKIGPSDRVGIIVVVTAGLNMKASGASTEMETVRKCALDAGIPIYVFKYTQVAGDTPEVNSLAESTYGQKFTFGDRSVNDAIGYLQKLYKSFDDRCYGQDYKITFTTTAKRDGKSHLIHLNINKVPQEIPPFQAPSMTFFVWVKEHVALFICILLLIIMVIVASVLLILDAIKKKKQKMAAKDAQHQQEIANAENKISQLQMEQNARINELKRQQQEAEERKQQAEEAERLANIMRVKNLFPRLQCSIGDTCFTYSIQGVITKLGRDEKNDVVLSHQTVSGFHAEIHFNGSSFDLVNKSHTYTQGLIVNGQLFQKTGLKNGDKIGLGEAVITFYV